MKMRKGILMVCLIFSIMLMVACGSSEPQNNEEGKSDDVTVTGNYTTYTKGYDWGPAIPMVIVNLGETLDQSSLDPKAFTVKSYRVYKDFDFTTYQLASDATDHMAVRLIEDVYVSNDKGIADESGQYLTFKMMVGPTLVEGSPYNYDFLTGQNKLIDTTYEITASQNANLRLKSGESVTFTPILRDDKSGNINEIADDFNNNQTYTLGDVTLLYASYKPVNASQEIGSNPLIIWLHGAGEGGTDTTITLLGNKVVNLATPLIQDYFGETGAYVLAPQAPTMWMDYNGEVTYNSMVEGSEGKSYYTEALMGLITSYVDAHPEIDPNRIYIGGCSNGGYMTVNMIINYPDYFAAAYPICEAYDAKWLSETKLEGIKNIPIWLTHAKTDGTVPIYEGTSSADMMYYNVKKGTDGSEYPLDNFSNALYSRLNAMGSKNVYYSLFDNVVDTSGTYKGSDGKPYEYMGHWSWIYTLNDACKQNIEGQEISLFEWLSQQSL